LTESSRWSTQTRWDPNYRYTLEDLNRLATMADDARATGTGVITMKAEDIQALVRMAIESLPTGEPS
jgi:sigma54-dependent transcription regulator